MNQGNPAAARPRLEKVLKEYPRTLVIPEALFRLGEVYSGDGRTEDSQRVYRQLADEYPYTEWGRRAAQRLQAATR
jgi:TolA-binding protein